MTAICRLLEITSPTDGMKVIANIIPTEFKVIKNDGSTEAWKDFGIGIFEKEGKVNGEEYAGKLFQFVGYVISTKKSYVRIIPPINDDWGYLLDNNLIEKNINVKLQRIGDKTFFKLIREEK